MRLIRVLFALFFSLLAPRALGSQETLASILCSELNGPNALAVLSPEGWKSLGEKLEAQAASTTLAPEDLDTCKQRFQSDLEYAEFILKGLEIVERTATVGSRVTSQMDAPALTEKACMEFGCFSVTDSDTPALHQNADLNARRSQYQKMWREFLVGLRHKIGSAMAAQVLELPR